MQAMPAYVSDVAAPCAWSLHAHNIDYHAYKLSIGFPLTVSGVNKKWGCIETGDAMNVQLCFSVVIYDIYSTCVEIQVTYLGTVGVLMMIIHKNERKKL